MRCFNFAHQSERVSILYIKNYALLLYAPSLIHSGFKNYKENPEIFHFLFFVKVNWIVPFEVSGKRVFHRTKLYTQTSVPQEKSFIQLSDKLGFYKQCFKIFK